MDLKTLCDIPPWEWPGDAATVIRKTLTDSSATAADRLLAAGLAGEITVINDEIAGDLLAIVVSEKEPDELRGRAAIALGPALEEADLQGFDDVEDIVLSQETVDTIQRTFHRVFSDARVPKYVRRRVLEASVRGPQDWHPEAVRASYVADDEEWRLTAVFCMRYIQGFDSEILEALSNTNSSTQYEAVRAAGEWGLDPCWPRIAKLVTDPNTEKNLLVAAIEAAASIRADEVPDIIGNLPDSQDADVAEAALEALSQSEDSEYWDEQDEEEVEEEEIEEDDEEDD